MASETLVPLTVSKQPKKPRKWLRRFTVAVTLLAIALWFAPVIVAKSGLTNHILASVLKGFDGTVAVTDTSLGWFSPVTVGGVTVKNKAGETLATAESVTLDKSLLSLARNQSDIGTITVVKPDVRVTVRPGGSDWEDTLTTLLNKPGSGGPSPTWSLEVKDATVRIVDRGTEKVLTVPTATVADRTATGGALEGTAEIATEGKTLRVAFTSGLSTEAKLTADEFPLTVLDAVATRFGEPARVSGTLTGTANLSTHGGSATSFGDGSLTVKNLKLDRGGQKSLMLTSANLTAQCAMDGALLKVTHADLRADPGTATFSGTLDTSKPAASMLQTPDLKATADLDAGALAKLFPGLLQLQPGAEIQAGKFTARIDSRRTNRGTGWSGTLHASGVRGVRDGRAVVWKTPVDANFDVSLPPGGGFPAVDRLDVKSDFLTASGNGDEKRFTLVADADLDKLRTQLGEFFDLSAVKIGGTVHADVSGTPAAENRTRLKADARFRQFVLVAAGKELRETDSTVAADVEGTYLNGVMQLVSGTAKVTAGGDEAEVKLWEPLTVGPGPLTGRAEAKLGGDLGRWAGRLAAFEVLPTGWQVAGEGTVSAKVAMTDSAFEIRGAAGDLANVAFLGAGLTVREPQVRLISSDATYDFRSGKLEAGPVQLASQTAGLATKKFTLTPAGGSYVADGEILANVNLGRLQQLLNLQSAKDRSDAIGGTVRGGVVRLETRDGRVTAKATLPVEQMTYGVPEKPTWAEPSLKLDIDGVFDPAADTLQLAAVSVARPEGLSVAAAGRVAKMTSDPALDLTGKLTYDLAKLEPQLKEFVGSTFRATGKGTRDFQLAGSFASGVNVSPLAALHGHAVVDWDTLALFGFDVNKGELRATFEGGNINFNTIEAVFGQTGKVKVHPTMKFIKGEFVLTAEKGMIVDKAKLTPAATSSALGFALPAIAKSSKAEGTVSFVLEDMALPISDPEAGTFKGALALHNVAVGPGPVISEIGGLLGQKLGLVTLANEQGVPVWMEGRRVFHNNLMMTVNGYTITTSGSVGTDGSLSMVADVPIPDSAVGSLLKNNPKIREAVAKKRVKVPVGGTVNKPALDPRAFQAAVKQFVEDVGRDAVKGKLSDELDKGAGKLLDKFLPKPPDKKE